MRFPRERVVVSAVLALLVGASVAVAATKRERSEAVYPQQFIPLFFSHDQHLKADVECEACHEQATKSIRSSDHLVPEHHDACDSCHDIDAAAAGKKVEPASSCETCHRNYVAKQTPPKSVFPRANLVFNHQVHKEKKISCDTCHNSSVSNSMSDVGLATRLQLPKMETCLACHDGKTAAAECATCHVTDGTGRLAQAFSTGVLRPIQGDPFGLDHGPRFEFGHGTRAKLDRALCMECHTEGSCLACHDSLQKPLSVHPNDYLTLHPVQARMDSTRCEACHRFQSFCAACHERVGLGMDSDPSLRARNVRVHPSYFEWVGPPSGPNHHAIAASRDIKTCMSCHREESCMACHAMGGVVSSSRGTNPHPDSFSAKNGGQAFCSALMSRNDRACLKCHTLTDLQSRGCTAK